MTNLWLQTSIPERRAKQKRTIRWNRLKTMTGWIVYLALVALLIGGIYQLSIALIVGHIQ